MMEQVPDPRVTDADIKEELCWLRSDWEVEQVRGAQFIMRPNALIWS